MSSFLVLPLVGSSVTVHITRINIRSRFALVEFGGNFNHGHLTEEIYEQLKKEIQIPKERDCDFEGNPGDLCLVEEARTWHRARILSRLCDKCNVFLIDDGRTLWVSNRVLARGHSSFFNLPPLMEFFILSSVSPLSVENRWSPTASEFINSLCGKSVCGCVQDVMMPNRVILLDIPSVLREMHELGFARKISFEKFKLLVNDSLDSPQDIDSLEKPAYALTNVQTKEDRNTERFYQYMYPELLPGLVETVEVAQVVNPLKIFCKLHVFSLELKKLSKQIHDYYEGTSAAVMERALSDGSPCATKGSNGKWCRSVIQQNIMSEIVKVFHVDYGMEDIVQVGNIRPLAAKFFKLPVVTYPCSMYGLMHDRNGWTADQIDSLRCILLNQIFVGKFEHQESSSGGIYYVTLYGNDNVNINSSFAVHWKCMFITDTASLCNPARIQSQGTPRDECHEHDHKLPVQCLDTPHILQDSICNENRQSKEKSVVCEHLFTIGSAVAVTVTYMESDGRFWCQMADNASSLKTLMDDIQNHYSCSQIQNPTGSFCVARHPDNRLWYRAQVVTHHLTPHVDVHLIDYGQQLKVSLQDLRPIHPEFLRLKRQAFLCSLFNRMSSECSARSADSLSDFLGSVGPAPFSNVLLKCTICAIMYDSQGRVLNMVEINTPSPNSRTLPVLREPISPPVKAEETPFVLNNTHATLTHDLNVGAKENVRITCVQDVNHFYGQLERNDPIITKMTKDIQQFCTVARPTRYPLSSQMMCLARYNDGQWHRCQIKSINSKIIVHFVDYGDVLALDESDVLPFPAQLSAALSIPFQAVQLKLFNVTLEQSFELNNWFENQITDCTFTATVREKNHPGIISVELYNGKTNINLTVKKKWKEIQNKKLVTKGKADKTLPGDMKPLGGRDCFNDKLQPHQDFSRNVPRQPEQSSFTVEKNENVDSTGWNESELSTGLQKKMDNNDKHVVYLCSKITDLPSRILNAGFVSEVYVSHCNTPSSFFIQLASEESDILALGDQLNCSQLCDPQVDFNQLHAGDLISAEYPDDAAWYRAVIRNNLGDGTAQVEFIDFGNEAALPGLRMRQLGLQFVKFPRYSIHCSLLSDDDDESKKEWTEEQMVKFKKATSEKTLLCHFIKERSCIWRVILKDQDKMLVESLQMEPASCDMSPTPSSKDVRSGVYKEPEVFLGQMIEVYASSIVGPNYFWCQYMNSEKLDKMSLRVQECGKTVQTNLVPVDHLKPGDPCIALFPDDQMWYRAQVINTSGRSVSVLFVDYGNESEICKTSLKAIPPCLLEISPQAFLCQLEGFSPTDGFWNDEAAATFFALLVDNPLKIVIQNVEETSSYHNCRKYHVQVECNMAVINDIMKNHWNCTTKDVSGQISNDGCLKPTEVSNFTDPKPHMETCMANFMTSSLKCTPPVPRADCDKISPLESDVRSHNNESESDSDIGFIGQCERSKEVNSPSILCLPNITDLPPVDIKQGFISEVYVSHVIDPFSFFVQLAKDENRLFSITEQLNSGSLLENELVQLDSIQHGNLVKAVFPDDGSWYRAAVKDTNRKDTIHIEFIDFGNEATLTLTHVCKLDEQFLRFPRLSINCCLKEDIGLQNEMEQGMCSQSDVLTKAAGKRLFCQFIKENNSIWEVIIADERSKLDVTIENLSLKLNDLDFSKAQNTFTDNLSFKNSNIVIGQTVEAYASSIVGPNLFWCQYADSAELDRIFLITQEVGNSQQTNPIPIDQLFPGYPCIALFSDSLWYRAEVISKSPNSVSILFVDYGNESETEPESIKPLPLSLMERPLQAFLCQLDGFNLSEGSWNENVTDAFYELMVDKLLKVTIQKMKNNLSSLSSPYYVKVQSSECVINDQMESFWTCAINPCDHGQNMDPVPFFSSENGAHETPNDSVEISGTNGIRSQVASPLGQELSERESSKEFGGSDSECTNHGEDQPGKSLFCTEKPSGYEIDQEWITQHNAEGSKEFGGSDGERTNLNGQPGKSLLCIEKSSGSEIDQEWRPQHNAGENSLTSQISGEICKGVNQVLPSLEEMVYKAKPMEY